MSNKVLFLGVYRDGTGWSHAAENYILALDAAGVEVVPRPIKLNDAEVEVPERIVELEAQSDEGCDVVIQHILPHMMDYCGHFDKNIGLFHSETSHFRNAFWAERLNLMDEAWVCNEQMLRASTNSYVQRPMRVMPVPCDPSKYARHYEKIKIPQLRGKFVFYTIGEVTRRKNLAALLKAYHLEFRKSEPVTLVIKANLSGMPAGECDKHVQEICVQIKRELKLYPNEDDFLGEIIITQRFDEQKMMMLHNTCDCFVMPSYGESWCIPAFDAMAMGKTPICSQVGGMSEFIYRPAGEKGGGLGGWLVPTHTEPCFGMTADNIMPDLFQGNENWESISIRGLQRAMREAFEQEDKRKQRADIGIDRAYDFSYQAVGEQMKEALEGELGSKGPYYQYWSGKGRLVDVTQQHSIEGIDKWNEEVS